MPDELTIASDAWEKYLARAETQVTAWKRRDPDGFRRRCEQVRAHVTRRVVPRVHVPPRLSDRAPRPRRRSSRQRGRAPARRDDPEPPLAAIPHERFLADLEAAGL